MTDERSPEDIAAEAEAAGAETPSETQQAAEADAAGQGTPDDQLADLRDKLLRAMAETENTRRRAEKDKAEATKYGITKFARDLLSVADNMRRAMEAVSPEERDSAGDLAKNVILGVEMVEKELLSTLEKHGVRKIDAVGEKFDPNRHQAVAEIPGTGQADGTVVEVFQVGYVVEDRLLRPAMVTIAKGGGVTGEAGPSGDSGTPADDTPGGTVNTTA